MTLAAVGPAAVLGCLGTSIALTFLTRKIALRKKLLDLPNARSSHTQPKPRLGGIGIIVPFLVASIAMLIGSGATAAFFVALASIAVISAVGLVDDMRPLPAGARFAAQMAAALAVLLGRGSSFTEGFGTLGTLVPSWLLGVVAVLWIVWLTNLYNFMDGIDGLAGGQAALAGAGIAGAAFVLGSPTTGWVAACLSASALGFLKFNYPPSSIFMGDVGSTAIGFFLAVVPFLPERNPVPVEVVLLATALFVLDATTTLIRRIAKRERFFQAHRTHYYQRPIACGVSHRAVTLTAYVYMAPLAAAAAAYPVVPPAGRAAIGFAAVVMFLSLVAIVRRIEEAAVERAGLHSQV